MPVAKLAFPSRVTIACKKNTVASSGSGERMEHLERENVGLNRIVADLSLNNGCVIACAACERILADPHLALRPPRPARRGRHGAPASPGQAHLPVHAANPVNDENNLSSFWTDNGDDLSGAHNAVLQPRIGRRRRFFLAEGSADGRHTLIFSRDGVWTRTGGVAFVIRRL